VLICSAGLLAGAATQASPVFKVTFKVQAVGGRRPPNIVSTHVGAVGTLLFDLAPYANSVFDATSATGKGFAELDILTPHPRTELIGFTVTGGKYEQEENNAGVVTDETVGLQIKVTASSIPCAKVGATGHLNFLNSPTAKVNTYGLILPDCGLKFGQTSKTARNSRVHVSIHGACLRQIASVTGAPLCASQASQITISDGSATAGQYFAASGAHKAGESSCTGQVPPGSSACVSFANVGATVTLTATVNGALSSGETLRIAYDSGWSKDPNKCVARDPGSGDCILAQTTSAETLKAPIQLPPDKTVTQSVDAKVEILTPNGQAIRTLLIGLCDPSKGETAPNC
jgi:hypothetical protein